jgi:hypothetical protein
MPEAAAGHKVNGLAAHLRALRRSAAKPSSKPGIRSEEKPPSGTKETD